MAESGKSNLLYQLGNVAEKIQTNLLRTCDAYETKHYKNVINIV